MIALLPTHQVTLMVPNPLLLRTARRSSVCHARIMLMSGRTQLHHQAKTLVHILQCFQSRCKQEYLTALREYHYSIGERNQTISVGDIIIVHNGGPQVNWIEIGSCNKASNRTWWMQREPLNRFQNGWGLFHPSLEDVET